MDVKASLRQILEYLANKIKTLTDGVSDRITAVETKNTEQDSAISDLLTQITGLVKKAGDTMSGILDMGGNNITNAADTDVYVFNKQVPNNGKDVVNLDTLFAGTKTRNNYNVNLSAVVVGRITEQMKVVAQFAGSNGGTIVPFMVSLEHSNNSGTTVNVCTAMMIADVMFNRFAGIRVVWSDGDISPILRDIVGGYYNVSSGKNCLFLGVEENVAMQYKRYTFSTWYSSKYSSNTFNDFRLCPSAYVTGATNVVHVTTPTTVNSLSSYDKSSYQLVGRPLWNRYTFKDSNGVDISTPIDVNAKGYINSTGVINHVFDSDVKYSFNIKLTIPEGVTINELMNVSVCIDGSDVNYTVKTYGYYHHVLDNTIAVSGDVLLDATNSNTYSILVNAYFSAS